ncbi:hypothetical protein [Pedobacter sp.]|uniref:hypothetical protein n=1 Tax=Pedobacter sp. TaxID=1411316 RepID=UPI003D7FC490
MRNSIKLLYICAFSFAGITACTFGDKGQEGRTDSAVVDTNLHGDPEGGHRGTGIDPDEPVHTKETSILKDTSGTDSAGRSLNKKP